MGDHADDLFAVLEGEVLADRLAVAGGQGDVVDPHGVGRAAVGEERDGLAGPRSIDPADPVVVADADAGHVGERLLALDPAVAGDDHPGILVDDVILFPILDLDLGRVEEPGPAVVAVGAPDLAEFVPDDLPAGRVVRQQRLDLGGPAPP